MPKSSLVLWVNSDRNALMSDWLSSSTTSGITVKQGDTLGVELHWVRDLTGGSASMQEIEWSNSVAMTLAIGRVEVAPTFGTYTLKYGSGTTSAIEYNATASAVQTALNALATITANGGVTVSKQGTSFRVLFNTVGIPSYAIEVGDNDLFPSSSVAVTDARSGSSVLKQIYQIQIKQSPVAMTETFINQDPAIATCDVIRVASFSGDAKIWRVSIYPHPKDGSFSLSWTDGGIPKTSVAMLPTISATDMAKDMNTNAIETAPDWVVKKTGSFSWDISTTKASLSALQVDGTGLISFSAKYCELSMNTVDVENLLAGNPSAIATLEIEVVQDGIRQTLLQSPITIVNDIIDESDYTIVQRSEVMPVESVVRYDTSQALTDPQKAQARTNIGALGTISYDLDQLDTTLTGLDSRLSAVEGDALTSDQKGAITSSSTPTALNPFATIADISTGGSAYAPLVHTHSTSAITGLSSLLDDKSDVGHTHIIDDVDGLQDALDATTALIDGKADLSHSHIIADVTDLVTTIDAINIDIAEKLDSAEFVAYQSFIDDIYATVSAIPTSNIPTLYEKEALTASQSPSTGNPFMTKSAVDYAILLQMGQPSTVLSFPEYYAVSFSQNPTATNYFVTVSHLGTSLGVLETYVNTLGFLANVGNSGTVYANPFPTALTGATWMQDLQNNYPLEAEVVINGSTYLVPIRSKP